VQTIKTAIVVVLLMTVTYSAYVALTAPPAELPQELQHIVEADGGFNLDDIDIGIGESGDETPPPFSMTDMATAADPALPPTLPPSSTVPGASEYSPPSIDSDPAATARLSDTGGANSSPSLDMGFAIPTNRNNQGTSAAAGSVASDAASGKTSNAAAGPSAFNVPSANDSKDPPSVAGSPNGFEVPDTFDLRRQGTTENPYATAAPESDPAAGSDVAGGGTASLALQTALANAIATADRQQEQDQLREALTTLSLFYNTPSLSADDRAAMLGRLDFLAGEVVYSGRHLLEQPYRVSSGETLETIAETLNVPWKLLATINRVTDPAKVVPGQELKVVRGPFRAEANLSRSELTLFLGELYAGRFPISVGQDPAPQPGDYSVQDKLSSKTYYALNGANIPAGDDRNPYGDVYLDLGNRMCIHGTAKSGASSELGCIRLAPRDASDISSILSKGSSVVVVR
jgi:lipoprotein-anchoring transpeptidase ErfK/SrfK